MRCEETEARDLLIKINAGAPLVQHTDELNPEPVIFVQVPVAIEAIQAGFLAGYEHARDVILALRADVARLTDEDRRKTEADEACARAAEDEITRLRAERDALQAEGARLRAEWQRIGHANELFAAEVARLRADHDPLCLRLAQAMAQLTVLRAALEATRGFVASHVGGPNWRQAMLAQIDAALAAPEAGR